MIRRSGSVASNSPNAEIQEPLATLRHACSDSHTSMNQISRLSLVTPAGNPSISGSVARLLQNWLPFSEPLPLLQLPAQPQNSRNSPLSADSQPNSTENCIPHIIAAASAAELQTHIIEQAVRIAVAGACRLTLTPLANSPNAGTSSTRVNLQPEIEAEQQIRMKLIQTDYRTLQHGLQITPPVSSFGDILNHLSDNSPLTVLLISTLDLACTEQQQQGLAQMLHIPGLAILAAEPDHE